MIFSQRRELPDLGGYWVVLKCTGEYGNVRTNPRNSGQSDVFLGTYDAPSDLRWCRVWETKIASP